MLTHAQSWAAVEEKLQMDVAIWKSEAAPEEYRELVEGAVIKFMDRGVAIISVGKLEWEVAPPSAYCDQHDDWLLVSPSSGFQVALRSSHGRKGVLQLCPVQRFVDIEDELNNMVARFFSSEERGTSGTPTLRRTLSQKKRVEIIGKSFGPPFVRCVNALQIATGISDVLDTILGFSAFFVSNQQILQVPEEPDVEDCYFYDKEDVEELRLFNAKKRNGALWVLQQVRDAAMKCQVAAEATSEASHLGVGMLLKMQQEALWYNSVRGRYASGMLRIFETFQKGDGDETHNVPLVVDKVSNSETNDPNPSSGLHVADPSGSSLENQSGDLGDGDNPPPTPSFGSDWQSDMGNDTFSETSWDVVDAEYEDDILGARVSDAESLDMMLRDRDPCGSSDCSNLINEFLNLKSTSTDEEQSVDGHATPRSSVLKRLASWSSSNSGWFDNNVPSFGSSVSRKIRTVPLETLAEEPACDPEIERLCLTFIGRAAATGDVLQWCSCKFNKPRSSIELRFQVVSFMEDDIATYSTGIVRGSPLRIEIFLDSANMRQNLLEGDVRISVHQGVATEAAPPVIGLSCYIPHLVRHYLKHHIRENSKGGYEFPDGELLTGLMKHVVAKLVFIKHSCCVCDHEAHLDPITSFVPRPCEQNLCQALHEAWLVVAPRMVLKLSTVECWLRTCFQQDDDSDAEHMLQYMDLPLEEWVGKRTYLNKLRLVAKWLRRTVTKGSWLKMATYGIPKTEEEHSFRARLGAMERENRRQAAAKKTPGSGTSSTGLHAYKTGYFAPDTFFGDQ